MGFTSTDKSIFSPDMPQTPENVAKVLDIAGWTYTEAAKETLVGANLLKMAAEGRIELMPVHWKRLLDKAGRRAFDHDEDAA